MSSNNDLGSIKVEKLNETNYHSWKKKIQLLLAYRELFDYINKDPPNALMEVEAYTEWAKSDAKPQAIIGLTIPVSTSKLCRTGNLLIV